MSEGPDETHEGTDDETDLAGLDAVLEYLRRTRGFDFTGYKRASVSRRMRRRMQAVDVPTFAAYVGYLDAHPEEFAQLFDFLLINVTSFFRDPPAWDGLAANLPAVLRARLPDEPIRVWCAGCATGEEAYTLAMVLAEALGTQEFLQRVKIYATDIDEGALQHARLATFSAKAIDAIPAALAAKYFSQVGSSYVFSKELRRVIIFGRHDLVQDAPISRVDLLTCRNTLMYFNAETQTRVLKRLHFALNDSGLLFLGKAEMLLTRGDLFAPVDLKLRIFARTPHVRTASAHDTHGGRRDPSSFGETPHRDSLHFAAFHSAPFAMIVVDTAGRLALTNHRASETFGIAARDVGRPFHDLEISYRPAELRSQIDRVKVERHAVHLRGVERPSAEGATSYFDVTVGPLHNERGELAGTQIAFIDVTNAQRLETELRRANAKLESAHEEIESTSEELETTNEELQSTIEELETTNEELQSANEELETMNEELQSTNEELQTMNNELRQRGEQLDHVNSFLGAVLRGVRGGVAVLDGELRVEAWNEKMEDLWGVRKDEVLGKPFVTLDIGLPIDSLTAPIRGALSSFDEVDRDVECLDRRGRKVLCKVAIAPLKSDGMKGVVVLVEEKQA